MRTFLESIKEPTALTEVEAFGIIAPSPTFGMGYSVQYRKTKSGKKKAITKNHKTIAPVYEPISEDVEHLVEAVNTFKTNLSDLVSRLKVKTINEYMTMEVDEYMDVVFRIDESNYYDVVYNEIVIDSKFSDAINFIKSDLKPIIEKYHTELREIHLELKKAL